MLIHNCLLTVLRYFESDCEPEAQLPGFTQNWGLLKRRMDVGNLILCASSHTYDLQCIGHSCSFTGMVGSTLQTLCLT